MSGAHNRPVPEFIPVLFEVVQKVKSRLPNAMVQFCGVSYLKVSQESPGRHRGSRGSLHVFVLVVAIAVLSEASILLLNLHQSAGDVGDPRFAHVVAYLCQAREDCSHCVDVVDSPAGTPHSVLSVPVQVVDAPREDLHVRNVSGSHSLKHVADDIGTRRVEDLCALVDLRHPKDESPELILPVILIAVEGWKSSVAVLGALDPAEAPLYFSVVVPEELLAPVVLLKLTIGNEEHSCIINVGSILELVAIRNASVGLNGRFHQILQGRVQLLRIFTCLQ